MPAKLHFWQVKCCGLDLNQHTLSGTSPSNWQRPFWTCKGLQQNASICSK